LRDVLASKTSFSLDALSAGNAATYIHYLGLVIENGTVNWEASARSLIERFDAFELLERWSGLPIQLPQAVVQAFSATPLDSRIRYLGLEGEITLPPLRYVRALELARATSSSADEARLLHDSLARWSELAVAFLTVLQWSERLWERDRDWHDLPVAARLAVVWAHADRILRIFLAAGSKTATLDERFAHFHASSIRHALPLDRLYDSDVASPNHITAPALLVLSLNAALVFEPPAAWNEEKANFIPLVTRKSADGDPWPLPYLFADRRKGTDSLRSYLANQTCPWLSDSFGRPEIQPLTQQGQEGFLTSLLTEIESNPTNSQLWGMAAMVGMQWFSEESLTRIDRATKQLQFPEASADADTRLLWSALSGALPYLSSECRTQVRRGLVQWAGRLRQVHTVPVISPYGSSPASKDAEVLIDITLWLCRRDRVKESFDELGREILHGPSRSLAILQRYGTRTPMQGERVQRPGPEKLQCAESGSCSLTQTTGPHPSTTRIE
jgi:hypothetical protein